MIRRTEPNACRSKRVLQTQSLIAATVFFALDETEAGEHPVRAVEV